MAWRRRGTGAQAVHALEVDVSLQARLDALDQLLHLRREGLALGLLQYHHTGPIGRVIRSDKECMNL